jgi:hypothetical protein
MLKGWLRSDKDVFSPMIPAIFVRRFFSCVLQQLEGENLVKGVIEFVAGVQSQD